MQDLLRTPTRPRPMFRPRFEVLEDRTVPATIGPDLTPNLGPVFTSTATTEGSQVNPDVAAGRDGLYVIVWQHRRQLDNSDIYARVIDNSGLIPTTTDIVVAVSSRDERDPAVAVDDQGNFAVTWAYDTGSGDYNIAAAQFSSTGARRNGGNFTIARQTFSETDPDVALSGNGDIVITYHRREHVYARLHKDNRAYVRDLSVTATSRAEYDAKVARSPDGRFSVAYVIDTNIEDVRLRRFDADGNLIQRRTIAPTPNKDSMPSVSMNIHGDTLVGWHTTAPEHFDNAVQARMVYFDGSLGPVRTLERGSCSDVGQPFSCDGFELDAPQISLQQDGQNDRFVMTYTQDPITGSSPEYTEYVVYDYSEDRALDRADLVEGHKPALVSWSRNSDEALFTWVEFASSDDDVVARKLTI